AFLRGRAAEPEAVLIARGPEGEPVGFAELSVRPFAEGCRTSPVAYLEGWYVAPGARRKGVGRRLARAPRACAARRRGRGRTRRGPGGRQRALGRGGRADGVRRRGSDPLLSKGRVTGPSHAPLVFSPNIAPSRR